MTRNHTDLLLIFAKNPELGKAKTRLARTVGDEAALTIYLKLLEHSHAITYALDVDKAVFYAGYLGENDLWSDGNYQKLVQSGDDLGARMQGAFDQAFSAGYERIVIMGTDCYDLQTHHLKTAFDELRSHDAVIGPARDGGYYLIGFSKPNDQVFANKNWSTDEVFPATMQDFQDQGWHVAQLPVLSDVDTEDDLGDLRAFLPA